MGHTNLEIYIVFLTVYRVYKALWYPVYREAAGQRYSIIIMIHLKTAIFWKINVTKLYIYISERPNW